VGTWMYPLLALLGAAVAAYGTLIGGPFQVPALVYILDFPLGGGPLNPTTQARCRVYTTLIRAVSIELQTSVQTALK
jgi:hypothetical protein